MLEAQNRRIDDLMERISLQQEKLDKQSVRIRTLQSEVRTRMMNDEMIMNYTNLYIYYFVMFSGISSLIRNLFQIQQSRQKDKSTDSSVHSGAAEQRDSPAGE